MVDLLKDCPVLESSVLVKYWNNREGLVTYVGRFLSCLSFLVIFCYLYCLYSVSGEIAESKARSLRGK